MKKILLIDNDEKMRNIQKRFLNDEGFEVIEAPDAIQGTFQMILGGESVDLILLDIKMPQINGEYMREVIKEWNPDQKFIVSSVYPLDEQRQMIPDASDYFDKSQGADVLLAKINRLLDEVS